MSRRSVEEHFNVSKFKSTLSFISQSVLNDIKRILVKPPESRKKVDIEALRPLATSVQCLTGLSQIKVDALFQVATLLDIEDGTVLANQYDICKSLYIIIDGCCGAYIQQQGIMDEMTNKLSKKDAQRLKLLNSSPLGTKIGELSQLEAFGNLCLESTGIKQTSTIVSHDRCLLLYACIEKCNEAILKAEESSKEAKLNFLRQCEIFAQCPEIELLEVIKRLTETNFSPTSCLIRQGDRVGNVYLICVGKCRIVKFYGNVPVDFNEIGKFEIVGNAIASLAGCQKHEYSVIASTYVKSYLISRINYFGLLSTCENFRQTLKKMDVKHEHFQVESVKKQLQINRNWQIYKNQVLEELVPKKQFMDDKFSGRDSKRNGRTIYKNTTKKLPNLPDNSTNRKTYLTVSSEDHDTNEFVQICPKFESSKPIESRRPSSPRKINVSNAKATSLNRT